MLRVEVRFPLGVYYALSAPSFGRPEWPPSPVRLVGALLGAAHETSVVDIDAARALLQRLCTEAPPLIIAPEMADVSEISALPDAGRTIVAGLRGPSRWAPRNPGDSEIKKGGLSTRNLGRERTEVHKGGVAVGDQSIELRWPSFVLSDTELVLLRSLADEVTFLGTSRSPVVVCVATDPLTDDDGDLWEPAGSGHRGDLGVRVLDEDVLRAFDARHEARNGGRQAAENAAIAVAKADETPSIAVGRTRSYVRLSRRRAALARTPFDPAHWGDMIVVELDSTASELRPKAAATFLLARAFREALLGAYAPIGAPGEAPPVLRGHGDEPHAAIVPLPFVGTIPVRTKRSRDAVGERTVAADGIVRGIAVLLPHEARLPDVAEQRLHVEAGLRRFVLGDDRRWVDLPGAGRLFLRLSNPNRPVLMTLREARYREPSRVWQTVVPVVHARRRTSTGERGVFRQVAADCRHVGLPEPLSVEVLRNAPLGGAPDRLLADTAIPAAWRGPLQGPRSHLRITFDRPVVGPLILGRARHFGVGLCVPDHAADSAIDGRPSAPGDDGSHSREAAA